MQRRAISPRQVSSFAMTLSKSWRCRFALTLTGVAGAISAEVPNWDSMFMFSNEHHYTSTSWKRTSSIDLPSSPVSLSVYKSSDCHSSRHRKFCCQTVQQNTPKTRWTEKNIAKNLSKLSTVAQHNVMRHCLKRHRPKKCGQQCLKHDAAWEFPARLRMQLTRVALQTLFQNILFYAILVIISIVTQTTFFMQ